MIYEYMMKSHNSTKDDENARYKSWEHCHKYFLENRIKSNNKEILCLHLAFYLASWGMLRGGAFLLQRDYLVHLPVIEIILDEKYGQLWDCAEEYLDKDATLDLIDDCKKRIIEVYLEKTKIVNDKTTQGYTASDTLVTKIMLGTFGCVPAYDRYFRLGVKTLGVSNQKFSRKSIQQLANYYRSNKDFDNVSKEIKKNGIFIRQPN